MPTTACYIIVATLMVPVLQYITEKNAMQVPVFAMHLFVFYFGLMADVTPPVGLASKLIKSRYQSSFLHPAPGGPISSYFGMRKHKKISTLFIKIFGDSCSVVVSGYLPTDFEVDALPLMMHFKKLKKKVVVPSIYKKSLVFVDSSSNIT